MDLRDRIIFFAVITLIFGSLQFIVYRTLRNYLKEKKLDSKLWKRLSIYPFIIFFIPFIYLFVSRIVVLPKIIYNLYIIPFFIFQVAILFIALYLIIIKLIKLVFIIIKYLILKIKLLKTKYDIIKNKKTVVVFDESRRAFIRSSTLLVTGIAFSGASIGVLKKDDFVIKKHEIKINNLPEQLKGLRIVQINDMHSGPFMEYEQMCVYTNVINDLYPDIILIPGDLTNTLASEIFPFIDAFKNLKSKYGVYVTLGNHDYFSDPNFIANKIGTLTPFNMMRNESQILKINGKELLILGIEDTRSSGAKFSEAILNYLEQTVSQAKKSVLESKLDYNELPKIMMYHKPYLFPEMLDKNIDLILSGHTHGGQIVLANFGKLNISIAAMVSPYISGLYKEKNSQMYISDGIGTVALPIRLNCPPEITVLTLV